MLPLGFSYNATGDLLPHQLDPREIRFCLTQTFFLGALCLSHHPTEELLRVPVSCGGCGVCFYDQCRSQSNSLQMLAISISVLAGDS